MAADINRDGFMTWEETFEADASAPERKILPAYIQDLQIRSGLKIRLL